MRDIIKLFEEAAKPEDIEIIPLNFSEGDLSPVLSKKTIELHYNKLANGYADRYNKNIGDKSFNYSGAFLHNMLFTQYRKPKNNNKPNGPMKGFIEKHFSDWDNFKSKSEELMMTLQGSGWLYLSTSGKLKLIHNHETVDDILLLVDLWEHAYINDYGSDKKSYLKEQWKIINWNVINTRWGKSL